MKAKKTTATQFKSAAKNVTLVSGAAPVKIDEVRKAFYHHTNQPMFVPTSRDTESSRAWRTISRLMVQILVRLRDCVR